MEHYLLIACVSIQECQQIFCYHLRRQLNLIFSQFFFSHFFATIYFTFDGPHQLERSDTNCDNIKALFKIQVSKLHYMFSLRK
ncbi:GSCOCG00002330001-RA-CDS [Cotesia congregata]|nr:GSCOCG00002330001-RA-CDS [Cotesia congregata]